MQCLHAGHLSNTPKMSLSSALCSIQAIRVFFMLRSLSLQLRGEPETQLPLTREEDLIKTDDVLDLSELAILSRTSGPGDIGSALPSQSRAVVWECAACSLHSLTQDGAEGQC